MSVYSESGDFEMVETFSRPSSVSVASPPVQPSEMLRDRPADEQDDALEAAVMASIEEEHARVAREARDAIVSIKTFIEGENARVAREDARIAAEAETRRMAEEEEARRVGVVLAILAKVWPGNWGMQLRPGSSISSISEKGSLTWVSTMPLNPAATEFVTFAAPAVSAVSEEGDNSDSSLPDLVALYSSEDDSEDDEPVLASAFGFSHKHPEGLHMNGHLCPFIAELEQAAPSATSVKPGFLQKPGTGRPCSPTGRVR